MKLSATTNHLIFLFLLIQFDNQFLRPASDFLTGRSAESADRILFHNIIAGIGRGNDRHKYGSEIVFVQPMGNGETVAIGQPTVTGIVLQCTFPVLFRRRRAFCGSPVPCFSYLFQGRKKGLLSQVLQLEVYGMEMAPACHLLFLCYNTGKPVCRRKTIGLPNAWDGFPASHCG